MYIYIYIYICICMYVYMYICKYTKKCISRRMYNYIQNNINTHICTIILHNIYIYIHMNIYVYIYIYIHNQAR